MKYREALCTAAVESVLCIGHPEAWRDLVTGLYGLLFIVVRLALLLTAPVSVPLVAWLIQHDSTRRLEQAQAARTQLLATRRNGRA